MQSYENLFINLFTSGAVSNKPENNLSQTQEKITTSANSKSFNEYLNEVKGSKDSEKDGFSSLSLFSLLSISPKFINLLFCSSSDRAFFWTCKKSKRSCNNCSC